MFSIVRLMYYILGVKNMKNIFKVENNKNVSSIRKQTIMLFSVYGLFALIFMNLLIFFYKTIN